MSKMTPEFTSALNEFVTAYQAMMDRYYAKNYPSLDKPVITAETAGRKTFAKIVSRQGSSGSVVAYIRFSDGAIVKGNWKQPEQPLYVRGSIYSEHKGLEAFNPHGGHIVYLR